ncbi:hypothetical protein [Arthrobacter luteolus]|uniref:hypothetical protein n=1 Tax=Arthrobacter luteolus TaxID=98672 RepID=UPI00083794F9|nr:hypothetical protein [Arthrobacter luteolus]
MTKTSNTHKVSLKEGPNRTTVPHFECLGSASAACRIYPACDCESWNEHHAKDYGPGHEPVQQDECWLHGWFDNDAAVYAGEDATDMRDNGLPDVLRQEGTIEYSFCEEWIEWWFVTDPAEAAA